MRRYPSDSTFSVVRRLTVVLHTFGVAAMVAAVAALWTTAHGDALRSTPGAAGSATTAIQALTTAQQAAGYWLTAYTRHNRFDDPRLEVNTFTPAIIVSLLEPIVGEMSLGNDLDRTRAYLRGQIEDTGVVRYHGRPDQPYLPRFGCTITPDADSTALAWTFAAPSDRPAASAVSVLERYRTEDGLFRTWLAPPSEYHCVDPGRDPNPPDVAINMHVYLFLARHAPSRARELCDALRRTIDQDRIWVYYQSTPLVPLLREVDLAQAGCDVHVPERRFQAVPEGQEPYLRLALAHRALALQQDSPPLAEVRELLESLAAGDFAHVRSTPPLLYHNDMTATTPRFYWSPEVGYALWLRTYVEAAQRSRQDDRRPEPLHGATE